MIEKLNLGFNFSQSTQKQIVKEKQDEKFTISPKDEVVGEITYNRLGIKMKYGYRVEKSAFAEYFTEEQLQRWRKSIDEVDATYSAYLELIGPAMDAGYDPMTYYDFCYLLEKGEIVCPHNVGYTEEIIKKYNWEYSVILAETWGNRDTEKNKKALEIMRIAMNLGMVSNDGFFLTQDEIKEIVEKKKYQEQQFLLEKVFESKHLLDQQMKLNEKKS